MPQRLLSPFAKLQNGGRWGHAPGYCLTDVAAIRLRRAVSPPEKLIVVYAGTRHSHTGCSRHPCTSFPPARTKLRLAIAANAWRRRNRTHL